MLVPVPLTIKQANRLVEEMHRHHKPCRGHRFSIGAKDASGALVGAVIVGRPVSREIDPYNVAEVSRLVTNGTRNACSFLYAAAARAAKAMGFKYIQTYILEEEPGTSLLAAGWKLDGVTQGGDWNNSSAFKGKRRTDQPMCPKKRFVKVLVRP